MRRPLQERESLPERLVVGVMGGTVMVTLLGVMVAWLIADATAEGIRSDWTMRQKTVPPPAETARMEATLLEDREVKPPPLPAARRELHGWGWVDPERRVVRMPIDKAIDLYLQRSQPREAP